LTEVETSNRIILDAETGTAGIRQLYVELIHLGPYRVLIVCTGNICRSPMAEGLLKAGLSPRLMEKVTVASAGTHAVHGNLPSAFAVQALQAWGVDIAAHRARMLTKPMVKQSDLVLAMEKAHLTYIRFMPLFKMKKIRRISEFDETRAPYDIPDPIGGDLGMYRSTAQLLKICVKGVCAYLENSLET